MSSNETTSVSVAIIGAGFGGLAAAIELERNDIRDYTVFEKGDGVGGVWRANHYPGAACDVPSPTYSYSFELETEWSQRFGTQAEIRAYLERTAVKCGVAPKVRTNTEIVAATFDEGSGRWQVELADGEKQWFDGLICATGQLSRPKIPALDGLKTFAGKHFHSAEWDDSVDITGKRVAIVGSGASAVQIVPAIADRVRELHVIQRSPNWVGNKWNHKSNPRSRRLLRTLPGLARAQHNLECFHQRLPLLVPHRNRQGRRRLARLSHRLRPSHRPRRPHRLPNRFPHKVIRRWLFSSGPSPVPARHDLPRGFVGLRRLRG
ncbi:flavin-containing monooxygenase [Nocardia pseudovaccinii]|uniref:flavin-containing monooxygenase n=1 Tax=Nocardia pseudovaccinii TaxID=189540 RepID=UPI0007A55EA9|nr:NAD(P)/FAD-dependent oxidoreductase [Nocardia pseudovaccinii]